MDDVLPKIMKFKKNNEHYRKIFDNNTNFTNLDTKAKDFIQKCITPKYKEECPY